MSPLASRQRKSIGSLVSIVETSDDAIISKDLDGVVKSWNQGAERLFGYTADEMIGKSVTTLIPADRHDEEPDILERIQIGERIEHYETVRLRKDGNLIDVSLGVSPLKGADGTVIGASKIARDITERKRAEARQEMLTRELHHRTKNIFSVVQAVISRSFADKSTVKEAEASCSQPHPLAGPDARNADRQDWQGADLAEVVRTEMSPYGRVTIEGPTVMLNAKAAQNFALAVHELATNAAKYGALSNQQVVFIFTGLLSNRMVMTFIFRWQEHRGPPVTPPAPEGAGSPQLFGSARQARKPNKRERARRFGGKTCRMTIRPRAGSTIWWHWGEASEGNRRRHP